MYLTDSHTMYPFFRKIISTRSSKNKQKCIHLYWQISNGFFNKLILRQVLKSWYTGLGPGQGFWRCFTEGLNPEFSLVCDSGYPSYAIPEGSCIRPQTQDILCIHVPI